MSDLLYENPYGGQLWMVFNSKKQFVFAGDAYSKHYSSKLDKGDYILKLQVRTYIGWGLISNLDLKPSDGDAELAYLATNTFVFSLLSIPCLSNLTLSKSGSLCSCEDMPMYIILCMSRRRLDICRPPLVLQYVHYNMT